MTNHSETPKGVEEKKLKNSIVRNEESFPEIFGLTEAEILEIFEAVYEYNTEKNNPSSYKDWCKMYCGIHKEGTMESARRNWLACVRWLKSSGKMQSYASQLNQPPVSGGEVEDPKSYGKDNHLDNCPFCNGTEKDSVVLLGYKYPYFRVSCTKCGVVVEDDRKDKVQAAWNMRNGVTWLERGQLAQSKQGSVPEQDKAWDLLYKHLEGCEDWSSGQRVDRESFIELGKKEFIIIPR